MGVLGAANLWDDSIIEAIEGSATFCFYHTKNVSIKFSSHTRSIFNSRLLDMFLLEFKPTYPVIAAVSHNLFLGKECTTNLVKKNILTFTARKQPFMPFHDNQHFILVGLRIGLLLY